MRKLIPLLLLCTNVQAGFYVEVGAGVTGLNSANNWDDSGEVGANMGFGYIHRIDNWAVDFGYQHYSSYDKGWPIDDRYESNLDAANITLRYEWR